MKQLRSAAGFNGQVMAAAAEEGSEHIKPVVEETDWIAYTPASRRRLLPLLDERSNHVQLKPIISADALEAMRQAVPA